MFNKIWMTELQNMLYERSQHASVLSESQARTQSNCNRAS